MHVRADEQRPARPAGIAQIEVPALRPAAPSPLRDLVRLEEGKGPSLINRIDRRRRSWSTPTCMPGLLVADGH